MTPDEYDKWLADHDLGSYEQALLRWQTELHGSDPAHPDTAARVAKRRAEAWTARTVAVRRYDRLVEENQKLSTDIVVARTELAFERKRVLELLDEVDQLRAMVKARS